MQEIAGRLVFREGVPKLLGDPGCRRMVGDGHMDDPSTVVLKDDQHEQQSEPNNSRRRRAYHSRPLRNGERAQRLFSLR